MLIEAKKIPYKLYKLQHFSDFETLSRDCMQEKFGKQFTEYGKSGQNQHGIDLISSDGTICIQCKNYQTASHFISRLENDFKRALGQFEYMEKFIITTALDNDKTLNDAIIKLGKIPENQQRKVDIEFYPWHLIEDLVLCNSKLHNLYSNLYLSRNYSSTNTQPDNILMLPKMTVIGFEKKVFSDTSYVEIPGFWDEISEKYGSHIFYESPPASEQEEALRRYRIGEYGVCLDITTSNKNSEFIYMIAGIFNGDKVPKGMQIHEFPAGEWAEFKCTGLLPISIQTLNSYIFKEWLPQNVEYELRINANLEWYKFTNPLRAELKPCESSILIPVKRRNAE